MTKRLALHTPSDKSALAAVERKAPQSLTDVQEQYRRVVLEKLSDGRFHTEKVPACVCGSYESSEVIHGDRFALPVAMVMCDTCGLLRTSPRLAAGNLPEFYDKDYHGLHTGMPTPSPELSLFKSGQGKSVLDYLQPLIDKRHLKVVEIGSGSGTVLREFAEAASSIGITTELLGCEYSDRYAALGRSVGIEIRTGGIEAVEDVRDIDLLILSHIVEHFADLPAELARVRRLCSDETLIFIEVPGVLTIHEKPEYRYRLVEYFTVAHTYHFTLTTLQRVMTQAGFESLCGDEQVRSVFHSTCESLSPAGFPDVRVATKDYLLRLETSPVLEMKRAALDARRWGKRICSRTIRFLAGEGGMDAARRIRRNLSRGYSR